MIKIKFDGNHIDYIEIDDAVQEEEQQAEPEPEEAEPEQKKPKAKTKRQQKPFDIGKAKALRKAGWTLNGIATEMKVSQQTVANHLKKAGMK